MEKYINLRKQYPKFNFNSYDVEQTKDFIHITYSFEIESLSTFTPCWKIPKSADIDLNDAVIRKLVFSLGLVELVSYWKITCSPEVEIKCGYLDNAQIDWWKKQYFYGLGEFFHVNKISENIDDFMSISCSGDKISGDNLNKIKSDKCLVPIGGGKDSVVTIEVLKQFMPDFDGVAAYIINPRGATTFCAEAAGFDNKDVFCAKRTLDKNMLELNAQGFLNGHTPFSAIVAFSSVLTAYINNCRYVVLSNEASANESTVQNSKVNHQYSKSFDFEYDFHEYEKQYINSGVYYFSLLRPLSEFQIAEFFAKQKKYHKVFKSCNAGSKNDIWCCNCPKCLFVYLILSPFLSTDELVSIFGENLLEKPSLKEDFEKLTGILPEKPFECVGSRDEINTAICMTIKKHEGKLPLLLQHYKSLGLYFEPTDKYETFFNEEHLLPEKFESALSAAVCKSEDI